MDSRFHGLVVAGDRSPLRGIRWGARSVCTFQLAPDGRSGLRIVSRRVPDVVLLDLDLADLPGLVVLRRIRGLAPDTPVLAFARRPDVRSATRAADLGVAGYITPPVDGPALRRRLGRLLRGAPRSRAASGMPDPRAMGLAEAALARIGAADGARLSVGALAATLGVSAKRLRGATRQVYGISTKKLMLKIRVQHALTQLRTTDEPIKAIATTFGFHDAAHLAHTVRRVTGAPPCRHRERDRTALRRWVGAVHAAEQSGLSHPPRSS